VLPIAVALAVVLVAATALASAHSRNAGAPRATAADANCSDFGDQAAAQRYFDAHGGSPSNDVDGLDGDHDGIACESNPCPCAKPGSTGGGGGGGSAGSAGSSLGRSVTLHPVRRRTGCHVRGALPDPACTPGAYYSKATTARICKPGYSKQVRHVTTSTKDAIYAAYGITRHFNGTTGEVDHLVSLELGGSNVRANLFPESASPRPGSHEKDKLENRLHAEVCSGQIKLRKAQREIASDWVTVYRHEFGG
jgi:hypothetical protein